ncbi:uncharacterized protein [Cicer arietinum]|uniref:Uncharacterized protein LOC101504025 n=1 Tax=Cicer arietinum TaxID=3827 RepID=A0A1S3EG87_CICAR|nr:uncharacterized protein LOC101504025 [Cicer arietinum]XP_012574855.1 uncharacterized protein LOC101504025 [Cicer arietinum]
MQSLKLRSLLFYSPLNYSLHPFLFSFSTASLSTPNQTTILHDFLNSNFNFPKSQSLYISKRISSHTLPLKPLSVLNFFKQIGFSESQIHSIIRQRAQILFSDVDKTLKPKIHFFQQLGFQCSDLCNFISKNPTILTASLNKTLVPSVEVIRKIVCNDKDFIYVLCKCGWILPKYQLFVANVAFLQRWGIFGDQLLIILKRQSRLLIATQCTIRNYVLQAVDLGFEENSRMLVHALHTLSGLSSKTFRRKMDFIQGFGFSKDECMQMFKKTPTLLRTSEKKLKVGMEFFLQTVMLPKSVLVQRPVILMYSIEDRVFPRYRVFQLLKAQNLCRKVPSFIHVLCLSEDMFLDKYISRFKENAEPLLIAYKGEHYQEA